MGIVEMILYVALVGIIAVILVNFLIGASYLAHQIQAEREVLTNARAISETMRRAVSEADRIYAPTSRFDVTLGQLSLRTPEGADTNHVTRFLDFWVDNGILKMRREGESGDIPLSGPRVRVTQFTIERMIQDLNTETLRITISITHTTPKNPPDATLTIASVMRGRY